MNPAERLEASERCAIRAAEYSTAAAMSGFPDETYAVEICESCNWPFLILAKDLACCRELKAARDKDPSAMSPRAGAVLCPMDQELSRLEAIARRQLGDIVDEFAGLPPGTNAALFRDWLRKQGMI